MAHEAATASARSAAGASERPNGVRRPVNVVAGDDPQVGVGAPAARDDAGDRFLETIHGEDAAREPTGGDGRGRVAAWIRQGAEGEAPGAWADRRPGALESESGTGGAVGLGRGA